MYHPVNVDLDRNRECQKGVVPTSQSQSIKQKSLEDAQKGLSSTDEEIRRLTGREPQTRPV